MKLPRKFRILTALVALVGLLFMQLAVAAYSCPAQQAEGVSRATRAMPGCDQIDPAAPALCHAHCLDAQSSLDKHELPAIGPAAVIVSRVLAPLAAQPAATPSRAATPSLLARSTAPPLAIRHCCWRI